MEDIALRFSSMEQGAVVYLHEQSGKDRNFRISQSQLAEFLCLLINVVSSRETIHGLRLNMWLTIRDVGISSSYSVPLTGTSTLRQLAEFWVNHLLEELSSEKPSST